MNDNEYTIKKNPAVTYISRSVVNDKNIHYISKVFDIDEFKDFYYEQKSKKVYEVIRESARQEITAIYDADSTGFSIRIQRFSKTTGAPQNQSFSFHSGAFRRLLKFIESLDLFDFSNDHNIKLSDHQVDELIERKKILTNVLNGSLSLSPEQLLQLFKNVDEPSKKTLLSKFIENIESYEAETLYAAIKQREYKLSLNSLGKMLDLSLKADFLDLVKNTESLRPYSALQREKVYQNWIEKNLWIFGVDYHKKHPFRKIASDNSQADIVLETVDGFLSLIEIKQPIPKNKLFRYDTSHRCYFPTSDLSEAIGQCLIYLQRIEDYKKNIESEYSVRVLRPRVKLIIGRTHNFNDNEREALHFLNSSLHDIDIISYDQLIENGKKIISYYEK